MAIANFRKLRKTTFSFDTLLKARSLKVMQTGAKSYIQTFTAYRKQGISVGRLSAYWDLWGWSKVCLFLLQVSK